MFFFFFFNDTATTEIYTLSLHDALPISDLPDAPQRAPHVQRVHRFRVRAGRDHRRVERGQGVAPQQPRAGEAAERSEEHTSELQSRQYLVCRLLLEKKKKKRIRYARSHI